MRKFIGFTALLAVCACAHAASLPEFTQPNAIWNWNVTGAALRPNSTQMMQHLEAIAAATGPAGKYWGDDRGNQDFQIDFSFYVLHATSTTPTKPLIAWPNAAGYYNGECEVPGFAFPVPPMGGIEGTSPPSYSCNASGEDCHLLVSNDTTHTLYETYNANSVDASGVHARCGLFWHLDRVYPKYQRGEHCTSADGAGFPIAPLLFNADEVFAAKLPNGTGDLGHAIRFIIGNERMQENTHVHPSSHGTSATSDTNVNAMPYGSRLRLKSTFAGGKTVTTYSTNESVRVVLRSLQKYGMFLSDGGGIPLTAEADNFTDHKWDDVDVNIDSHSFFGLRPTDFDVIEDGDPIPNDAGPNNGDCLLTPADFVFIDGFDF